MGIFSGNTVEWMLAMQAGNYYSIYTGEWSPSDAAAAVLAVFVCRAPLPSAVPLR